MKNLDQEMKLWEERSNDEFGTILKALNDLTKDYFAVEMDEYDLPSTPLDDYIASYSIYGNRKRVANNVRGLLYNRDILGNDAGVENLVNELFKLI